MRPSSVGTESSTLVVLLIAVFPAHLSAGCDQANGHCGFPRRTRVDIAAASARSRVSRSPPARPVCP